MQVESPVVNLVVEGPTDEAVVRRVLALAGLNCGRVFGKQGKANLLGNLARYNQAAQHGWWLVVADLDQDAPCAPDFVRERLPEPACGMVFRVAVRAIESWLLGDLERAALWLDVPKNRIPLVPDADPHPKATLIDLARSSRRRVIRDDLVPRAGSGASEGPGYRSQLEEFVSASKRAWRPEVAAHHSDSLRRCIEALRKVRANGSG